ncbi:MAG: hypothetical protein V3R94_04230 [Acidobacteriota bacterium]
MKKALIIIWMLGLVSCGAVKKRITIEIPPSYAEAQVASLEELLKLINERYGGVEALSASSLKVEFTGGSVATGYVEEYRSAKGYLVAQWPDSMYFNILNPLTSSTVAAMATTRNAFQIWIPRENKFFTGNADVVLEEENPILNVRPHHLLKGILVEPIPLDSPRYRYFLEEAGDARFKYYVVGVIDLEGDEHSAQLVRKLWIERSSMHLVRQQYYQSGTVASSMTYGDPIEVDGMLINSDVKVERTRERYSIRLELDPEGVRINPSVREDAFILPVPSGAERVVVE